MRVWVVKEQVLCIEDRSRRGNGGLCVLKMEVDVRMVNCVYWMMMILKSINGKWGDIYTIGCRAQT